MQEQIIDMISALQIAHISIDRKTRENSGALRTMALILADPRGDLPKWVKAGIEENEAWLKEMKERPGENIGSPHVRVCLIALHALLTSEEIQQQKFEQPFKALKEWWKVVTKEGQAKENEVASEIKIFKIRGPPKKGGNFEDDEEMEQGSTASTTSGGGQTKKVYARMEFMMETKDAQVTLRKRLEQLGAEINKWSCSMSTADAESQGASETPSADGIWQQRLMPPETSETMEDVWRPHLGASSCERPILRDGCPPAGASSFVRPCWHAEQSSAADPDLFPMVGEDPEADFF